jgi:phage terminase large subunit-like protein
MTHVDKARAYAADVLAGRKPACRWERLACQRFVDDLAREGDEAWPYRFDERAANKVCRFAEKLPHVRGKWALKDALGRRQLLKLEPWQCFILCNIFGWLKKATGKRRFLRASLYEPRKNGKSLFAAAVGLYMLAADGEEGAEVYSGATSRKQAMEVFKPAWQIVKALGSFQEHYSAVTAGTFRNPTSIYCLDSNSRFEPVIGKPGDGASPHCAIIDEFHEHATSDLYDTMSTGMGAREQPLLLVISTAGDNLAGPCKEDWDALCAMLENTSGERDETWFGIIYALDKGDAWTDEAALIKANPNWGVSIIPDKILQDQRNAARDARKQGAFRTKHTNAWVQSMNGYFNLEEWEACRGSFKPDEMLGAPCYLAGDFANKSDLTTLVHLFPLDGDRFRVFCRHYVPRATVAREENQHLQAWERGGWLTVTDGSSIDYTTIVQDAAEACAKFDVKEMPFDPNRAWGVMPMLQAANVPVVEYRIVVLTMSEPMKKLAALMRSGGIEHNGDPVLAWAISNVVAQEDRKENVFPNKPSADKKIDPAVALIMALGRAMVRVEQQPARIEVW